MKPLVVMICAVVSLLCCLEIAHSKEIIYDIDGSSGLHFAAGAFISNMTAGALYADDLSPTPRRWYAFGVGCLAGLYKENKDPAFNVSDLAFTVAGSATVFLVDSWRVNVVKQRNMQGIAVSKDF